MNTDHDEGGVRIKFRVNGRDERITVSTSDTLVDVLRGQLGLFSCRETCGIGVCGTCTVLIDGRPSSACLTLAFTAEGAQIETVEGLVSDGELSDVQQAFVEEQAFQCSFCTPGFVMSVEAWRRREEQGADPSDAAGCRQRLDDHLSGHLCRCGCYRQILAAAARLIPPDVP